MSREEPIHALVWSEGTEPEDVYPNGIHAAIAESLNEHDDVLARMASIDDTAQGVGSKNIGWADTIVWYSHNRNSELYKENIERITDLVEGKMWSQQEGAGFIALHSAQLAHPFRALLGDSEPQKRKPLGEHMGDINGVRIEEGEEEHIEVMAPDHPIAEGIEDFVLSPIEVFNGPFNVPEPDTVVFNSTYSEGGEFPSGVTFSAGEGRVFYLRPGHEPFGYYYDPRIRRIIYNAVRWSAGRA